MQSLIADNSIPRQPKVTKLCAFVRDLTLYWKLCLALSWLTSFLVYIRCENMPKFKIDFLQNAITFAVTCCFNDRVFDDVMGKK